MSADEALEIIEEYGLGFEINDSGFADGSKMLSHDKVFDSERHAKKFIQALEVLLDHINGEL